VDVGMVVPSSAMPSAPAKVDIVLFNTSGQPFCRSTVNITGW